MWAEKKAEEYLVQNGFKILARRWRSGSRLELDIVAQEKDVLVFVEVKCRKNEDFGRPFDMIDRKKRENMSKAALRFISTLKRKPEYFRFDVVEVVGSMNAVSTPVIRHIRNAFTLDSKFYPVY